MRREVLGDMPSLCQHDSYGSSDLCGVKSAPPPLTGPPGGHSGAYGAEDTAPP